MSCFLLTTAARADMPGRGITAPFEVEYLRFIIDHHFSALRMTELVAGTDPARDPPVENPGEGTSRTPGFDPTASKSTSDELKSMARRENRAQREEIAEARRFLRQWYGLTHEPAVPPSGMEMIRALEASPPGDPFDHMFMEMMSRHHFMASMRSLECQVSAEMQHEELIRYCRNVVHNQVSDIQSMRMMLCRKFSICDYQPLQDPRGRHSGGPETAVIDFGYTRAR